MTNNNQNFKSKMNTEFGSETDVNEVKQQIQQAEAKKHQASSSFVNNNQINEQKKDSRPKELIDLAGKYAEAFDIKSIDIPDYLIEKLRPIEEITLKKNESFEEQETNKNEKTKYENNDARWDTERFLFFRRI